jgi:hypothetical protein
VKISWHRITDFGDTGAGGRDISEGAGSSPVGFVTGYGTADETGCNVSDCRHPGAAAIINKITRIKIVAIFIFNIFLIYVESNSLLCD